MPHPPTLDLSLTATTGREHLGYLRRHVPRAHALLRPALVDLSIALVGDARMSEIHQSFLGIAGPTDVITFPLDEDARGRVSAGEVVVCVPEARRRCRVEGTALRDELLLYAIHGMLHLCGFDDRAASEYRKMHAKEDELLRRLGIGAQFERVSAQGARKVRQPVEPSPLNRSAPRKRTPAKR